MANLQATKITSSLNVQSNTFVKLGTAYFSSGGNYAHIGQNAYYNGAWIGTGSTLQLSLDGPSSTPRFLYAVSPSVTADQPFVVDSTGTTMGSTSTTFVKSVSGNSTTNSTVGIGAAAGSLATDGKLFIRAGGSTKPILEVMDCAGNGSTNSSTYTSFKGWLAIKINSDVGGSTPSGTAIVVGTYYIRLWG